MKKDINPQVQGADNLEIMFHQAYLDEADIDVYFESDRKSIIKKIASTLEKTPTQLSLNTGEWFEDDYYAATNSGDYYYYRKLKNNRPHGFGVITTTEVDLLTDSTTYLVYAGNFNKGRYNGYGVLFDSPILMGDTGYYVAAHVSYDGKWKDGIYDNKGNFFSLSYDLANGTDYKDDVIPLTSVIVSEISKGELNGKTKVYENGCITYNGETKDGAKNGTGISYYPNGKKKYDGKWKKTSTTVKVNYIMRMEN